MERRARHHGGAAYGETHGEVHGEVHGEAYGEVHRSVSPDNGSAARAALMDIATEPLSVWP